MQDEGCRMKAAGFRRHRLQGAQCRLKSTGMQEERCKTQTKGCRCKVMHTACTMQVMSHCAATMNAHVERPQEDTRVSGLFSKQNFI